jgi:amidophosphoribosyltransferase
MGGFFGVASKKDCVTDLFYGTDYHSHLGTMRGGMATVKDGQFTRFIHDITNSQFRSKFEHDVGRLPGALGIGVISDYEDQPLVITSHLGTYAIVTVGKINNSDALMKRAFHDHSAHISNMTLGEINPTELVATLINQEDSFEAGIVKAQNVIQGSCSLLILTPNAIYAARDKLGRTPVILGRRQERKNPAFAVTMESCAFPNLDFETVRDLGPGEVVKMTPEGVRVLVKPGSKMRICAFLWVYYGYPASSYEGVNVEVARNRCGAMLARMDRADGDEPVGDVACGIPDSGVGHALGYAMESGIPYRRPFVKYTPTWPRSFMPQDQDTRQLIARMKLIPIRDLVVGRKLLFCEDSIVRGTQLRDTLKRLRISGAKEIHMRPACPPLAFGCKYLNFSRSKSLKDLAVRRAVEALEGKQDAHLDEYTCAGSARYCAMLERIRKGMKLDSLKYQRLDDLVTAIGIPAEKLCTHCWSGRE